MYQRFYISATLYTSVLSVHGAAAAGRLEPGTELASTEVLSWAGPGQALLDFSMNESQL